MSRWIFLLPGLCWAQGPSLGVWHLVDVLSVICPGGPGYATITMSKPTSAEYEPHILSVFRTAKQAVDLKFVVRDGKGIVADQGQGITLTSHARRMQAEEELAETCEDCERELFSMRRRTAGGVRRRAGSFKPVNMNPMGWFTPRRRTVTAAGYAAAGAAGVATVDGSVRRRGTAPTGYAAAGAAGVAPDGSVRRRGTGPAGYAAAGATGVATDGSVRRRGTGPSPYAGTSYQRRRMAYGTSGGFGGSYSNPYSSYTGPYGYPSASYASQSFGGQMPVAAPYGYTGANAYSGSSGTSIALAAGAGLLAGYAGSHLLHHHHHWYGYSRNDMFNMQCTSGSWTGLCNHCVSSWGARQCNVMISPKFDAARDDLMSTGFLPAQVSWPLVINVTHVSGPDFDPATICPPQDPEKKAAWQAPPMKQLFFSLSALPSQGPSLGAGSGYGYNDPYANASTSTGSAVLSNLLLLCTCLACCYGLEKCRKGAAGPPMAMYDGPLPGAAGMSGAPNPYWHGQDMHYDHGHGGPGHYHGEVVQGQVID